MAIMAVRLRPIDKKRNYHMATFVSATSRTKYTSGTERNPSPFRILAEPREAVELREIPQFEIMEFEDMADLQEHIQQEMEQRARMGLPAVRAQVISGSGVSHEEQVVAPRKTALDKLPPAATSDPTKTNTGRKPLIEDRPGEDPAAEEAKKKNRRVRPAPRR